MHILVPWELLVSYREPPQEVERGMLTRYGGYLGNKIPGVDQNQHIDEDNGFNGGRDF